MDIVGDYRKKLEELQTTKNALNSLPAATPELTYLKIVVDQQISDTEKRLGMFTSSGKPYQTCTYCHTWIKQEGIPTSVGELIICDSCKATIRGVINTQQAEDEWGLSKGTIRQDCHPRRGVLQQYIEAGLIFQSGRYWHIHTSVMIAHYGQPKAK